MPNTSTLGLWLILVPLWVKYKLSGAYFGYPRVPDEGREGMGDMVIARTLYIDRIIRRVAGDMDQFVLLGAGYDTRAYGEFKRDGLAFFELDQAPNQELKVASLGRAGIEAAHVTFVSVDFSREDAFEKLRADGNDPALDPAAFEDFLTGLAEEGADRTYLDNGEVREYLEYLIVRRIARRMDRMGRAVDLRARRDPVLAEAIRLLGEVETQAELFAAADRLNEASRNVPRDANAIR